MRFSDFLRFNVYRSRMTTGQAATLVICNMMPVKPASNWTGADDVCLAQPVFMDLSIQQKYQATLSRAPSGTQTPVGLWPSE